MNNFCLTFFTDKVVKRIVELSGRKKTESKNINDFFKDAALNVRQIITSLFVLFKLTIFFDSPTFDLQCKLMLGTC